MKLLFSFNFNWCISCDPTAARYRALFNSYIIARDKESLSRRDMFIYICT